MTVENERLALAAFLVSSFFAGGNAVGVRFSNRELAPLWGAGLRFSLAALLLLGAMAVLRLALPRGQALAGALLFGALNFGGAFALAYYGLQRVHAGLGQTLLAVVPLATLLLAVLQRQERLRAAAVVGTLLALGMAAGAAVLLVGSALAREPFELPNRAETWLALGYLVAIGSIVVFVLYLMVLRYWPASRAAYTFVLVPVVTVVLSAWLDDEPIRGGLVLGGLLVLVGVYIGALRPRAKLDQLLELHGRGD